MTISAAFSPARRASSAAARASAAARSASLRGEKSQLQKDIERLQAERAPIASQIHPEPMQIYDRLRRQKKGLAVAGIVDSCCTGCGSTLTQAEWQAARSPQQITYCPFCGRLLYAG